MRRPQPIALPGMEQALAPKRWSGAVQSSSSSRKGPPPAPRPWECVVLGVDTAARSGWSIWSRGKVLKSSELDTRDKDALRAVIAQALDIAAQLALPCVLVLEKPWGGNVDIVAGLGRAAERWLDAWRELATGHVGKVVRVQPSTWRSAVLGKQAHGLERGEVRALEQLVARGILRLPQGAVIGSDEAPGVLIGCWGSRAGEVGAVLSKTAQKQSLKAWTAPR